MTFGSKFDMFSTVASAAGRYRTTHKHTYPDVPASLRSDSIELKELHKAHGSKPDSAPYITPYLSLQARLSQIWINRWTVLLLLVLLRVLLLIASLNDTIGDSKAKALSACTKVEDIGSAMASMPHYLSVGVNELSATGIEKAVHGMTEALMLAITVIQNLILFIINMFTSTYVCLATALIHGGLDVASTAVTKATELISNAASGIANAIDGDARAMQDSLNRIVDGIESSIFGNVLPDVPKIDFTNPINDLKSFKLDASDFTTELDSLNAKIPTFDEVKNLTDRAISFPFELIKNEINSSFGGYTFDRSIFPIAQKQQLTFCSNNDSINSFFDKLFKTASNARTTFIVVLSILAVLAIIPMGWLEILRWRRQRQHAKIIEQNQYDSMDIVYLASRPMTSSFGIRIASRFKGKRQVLVRWCIAYATTLPAIFVLCLALAGFFSCLCQFIMLKVIEKQVPELAQEVGNFASDVVDTLESVSDKWASDTNSVILDFNQGLNNDILGYVRNGTSAVNDTLNVFTTEMEKGLNATFGNTVFRGAVDEIIRCLIGLKVEAVQKGLTFIHDKAHVEFPLFPNNTFSLGAQKSIEEDSDLTTFLASPSSITTDEVTDAVLRVTEALERGIVQEALISTGLLLVYVIVVLIGVIRMLFGMVTPDKTRAEGGMRQAYPEDEYRGNAPHGQNFKTASDSAAWDEVPRVEKSFTPGYGHEYVMSSEHRQDSKGGYTMHSRF
jgi:hypothetical protein